jgi:hypothetical protein
MLIEKQKAKITRVPCPKCNRIFKAHISLDILEDVERYPFNIVLMHVSIEEDKKEVHTLVAYIDKELKCRHVNLLLGKKLFITPFILYNPSLLSLSCNKNITKF